MNAIHDGILVANDKLTWLLIVMLAAAGLAAFGIIAVAAAMMSTLL